MGFRRRAPSMGDTRRKGEIIRDDLKRTSQRFVTNSQLSRE
jgi:hypothetical protein